MEPEEKRKNIRLNEDYSFLSTGGLSFLLFQKKQHKFLGTASQSRYTELYMHIQALKVLDL